MTVDIYGADRDQRLLATILLDGNDINLAMIEAGLAGIHWGPESGNPYQPQYQLAEQAARCAKKGMWVLGDAYESPAATGAGSGSAGDRWPAATVSPPAGSTQPLPREMAQ